MHSHARRTASRTTSTAGMAMRNCSHCLACAERKGSRSMPNIWLAMSSTTSASDSGTATIQNRRVKSRSSGLSVICRRHAHRLERHAADRAMAGAFLHDLRVHRAGIERALQQGLRVATLSEIALRVGLELQPAAFRAEIIGVALMGRRAGRGADVYLHPADGIDGHRHIARCRIFNIHIFHMENSWSPWGKS